MLLSIRRRFNKPVRFQFLTAASMKLAVIWVEAPCSLIEVYRRFRGTCCLHHQGVSKTLPDYTAQQPRRQPALINLSVECTEYFNGTVRERMKRKRK
jgi:hypothetical protein